VIQSSLSIYDYAFDYNHTTVATATTAASFVH